MINSESTQNVSSRRSFIRLVALGGGVLFFWVKMGGSLIAQDLNQGKGGLKAMSKYDGKLLNLASNFVFVGFFDEVDGKFMGKVINIDNGSSWKPSNKTTAFLLYLLCRESNDNIPYATFTKLVNQKFTGIPPGKIDSILDWLSAKGALDTAGTGATPNADPLQLFSAPQVNWEEPSLITAKDTDYRTGHGHHGYSSGYMVITIHR